MLSHTISGSFKKDHRLLKKQNKDMSKLYEVMNMLINGQPLMQKHENHPLHGKWNGKFGCHIEPDWVLIYRVEKEINKIVFYRTGSHSDLF